MFDHNIHLISTNKEIASKLLGKKMFYMHHWIRIYFGFVTNTLNVLRCIDNIFSDFKVKRFVDDDVIDNSDPDEYNKIFKQ